MKRYTQKDFDNFKIDEQGNKICPSGDYTEIDSFGERCSFGEDCKIENDKELNEMIKFEGFGSEHRCTYFFKLADGKIYVRCGYFAGYIDEFRNKVRETHGNNKFAKEYEKIADLAELHFTEVE